MRLESCIRDVFFAILETSGGDLLGANAARQLAEFFGWRQEIHMAVEKQREIKLINFIKKGKWQLAVQVINRQSHFQSQPVSLSFAVILI